MNLYKLHTQPEELLFHDKDLTNIPKFAYKEMQYINPKELAVNDNKRLIHLATAISKDPHWAYRFAVRKIGTRWINSELYPTELAIRAENTIMQSPEYAYKYAYDVMRERWPEAEKYIQQDVDEWKWYKREFNL